jgi:RND superfamily putative drug exporter
VIVATRAGGLDERDLGALRELDYRVAGAGDASPPQASDDRRAAVVVVPFTNAGEDELVAAVETLRERLSHLEELGLEVHLTGGAGFAADVSDVFGGINGVLLIGAATIVLILLVVIYRSPVFWLIPFFTVLLAEGASRGSQYLLGEAGFSITGQAAGTASVLVFGAATDYALLLVSRYREELEQREDTHEAMAAALRGAAPAIVASAMTVVLALLTLLLARVGSSEALGPLAASGVFLAMIFSLTLLPATLLIAGRRAFWPRIPSAGRPRTDPLGGRWGRLGARIRRRPRPVWAGGTAALIVLALGLTQLDLGLSEGEQFVGEVEAVDGAEVLARAGFRGGGGGPLQVVVPVAGRAGEVADRLGELPGVAATGKPERGAPGARIDVGLEVDPYGAEALALVPEVRRAAREADRGSLVGGSLAEDYDTREAAERDNLVVMPRRSSWCC